MTRYLQIAFHQPSKLIIFIIIVGIVMLLSFLSANDSSTGRIGSGVASMVFLPCLFLFVISLSVGAVVGARYIGTAYEITSSAMDAKIQEEYFSEIKELERTNVMVGLLD